MEEVDNAKMQYSYTGTAPGFYSEEKCWHNLQITLDKQVSKIFYHFDGRDNSSGWHDNPTHITLYGTHRRYQKCCDDRRSDIVRSGECLLH